MFLISYKRKSWMSCSFSSTPPSLFDLFFWHYNSLKVCTCSKGIIHERVFSAQGNGERRSQNMLSVFKPDNRAQAYQSCWPLLPISFSKHSYSQTHTHVSCVFRNVLLWGCRLGFSDVCAFPHVITLYCVSGKWLVYFGNLAIYYINVCGRKEKCTLALFFTLSETTFGTRCTAIKSPRQRCHKM